VTQNLFEELFDKVQEQLKRDNIVRQSKEFAFTKLITCGVCESGISAEEKYKQLKDGTSNKYIYYGCSRSKDRHCKNQYIREEDLVDQLIKLMNKVVFNPKAVQIKFEEELKRFNKFHRGVLGVSGKKENHVDIDLKTYAKYILKEGSNEEKRELMGCLESRVVVKDKIVFI
jgi:uncharacterized CHY-type Zn-finger protein